MRERWLGRSSGRLLTRAAQLAGTDVRTEPRLAGDCEPYRRRAQKDLQAAGQFTVPSGGVSGGRE